MQPFARAPDQDLATSLPAVPMLWSLSPVLSAEDQGAKKGLQELMYSLLEGKKSLRSSNLEK